MSKKKSDKKSARVVFIGAGIHSTGSLYPNIAHIPEFDLAAVCDVDEAKAKYAARKYGALEHFTDTEKMLEKVAPDGACICGPAEMHHAVALQCLSHGVPVFVEKPPAADAEGALELLRCAEQNKTWGMVAFMKRFAPASVLATEYMRSAEFGALSAANLIHGCGPYKDVRRMLLFNGIHFLDLARFFGGDIESLSALTGSSAGGTQSAIVNCRFKNGAICSINLNSGHTWSDCYEQTYLVGVESALVIDTHQHLQVMSPRRRFAQGDGLELYGWTGTYRPSANMAGWWPSGHYTRGYWGELNHFVRALLAGVPPTPSLRDGVAAMRMIDAIIKSGENNGQSVRMGGLKT